MYSTIKPYGAIKEHEKDYLMFYGNHWFIHTYYGGIAEITKEEYDRLERQGMKVR